MHMEGCAPAGTGLMPCRDSDSPHDSIGRAAWLDKNKSRCLVLWKTHAEWADAIYDWARTFGLNDSVVTIDDLSAGDDVEGTGALLARPRFPGLKGLTVHIVSAALRCLL